MQYTNGVHFIGPKDCPFKYMGKNLFELRRPKIRKIAAALNVPNDGTKNEILGAVITRLKTMGAQEEITESMNE